MDLELTPLPNAEYCLILCRIAARRSGYPGRVECKEDQGVFKDWLAERGDEVDSYLGFAWALRNEFGDLS